MIRFVYHMQRLTSRQPIGEELVRLPHVNDWENIFQYAPRVSQQSHRDPGEVPAQLRRKKRSIPGGVVPYHHLSLGSDDGIFAHGPEQGVRHPQVSPF